MSYNLNTDLSTKKITLCSTGRYVGEKYRPVFTLERALNLDDRLLHICSVEMVSFTHPTYFHEKYLNGQTDLYDIITGIHTTEDIGPADFLFYLKGAYFNKDLFSAPFLDSILFGLLAILKAQVNDPGLNNANNTTPRVWFEFEGFVIGDFIYNNFSTADMIPANIVPDLNNPAVLNHDVILTSLMQRSGFRFKINCDFEGRREFRFKGNFASLFGLDPKEVHLLKDGSPLSVKLPIYGHDYVCLGSSIGSNILSSTSGEKLDTSNLLAVVPTPNYPDDTEVFYNYGGKVETSSSIIDQIELQFTDVYGNYLLSLEDFIVTIAVDQVKTEDLPKPEHVSLFDIRKRTMEEVRKKIRTEL